MRLFIRSLSRGGVWDSLLSSAVLTPVGTLFQFLLTVVVARSLDESNFGTYVYSLQLASLVAVVISGGIPMFSQKIIPAYKETGNLRNIDGFLSWALVWIIFCCLSLIIASVLLHQYDGGRLYIGVALSIIPVSLWLLQLYASLGFNRVQLGIIPRDIATPLTIILILQLYSPDSALELLLVYNIILIVMIFIGYLMLIRAENIKFDLSTATTEKIVSWVKRSLPMSVSSLAQLGLNTLDLIVLGIIGTMAEVGAYGACYRIALGVSILNKILTIAVGQKLSALVAAGKYREVASVYKQSMFISAGAGLCFVAVIVFFGRSLLSLFGESYTDFFHILLILSVGNFTSSLVGPIIAGHNMIENQKYIAYSQLFWMLIALVLYFVVAPSYSSVGVAFVTATTMTIMKFTQYYKFRLVLREKIMSEMRGV